MYAMVPTDMLDDLVSTLNPKVVVEIGAYYGGWSIHLDKITADDAMIFSFQSPIDSKLNHVPDTGRGEHNDAFGWKNLIRENFPEPYHDYFDFNLLADAVARTSKVTMILDTSPLRYPWKYTFDLCTIDISPEFAENKKQFLYWSQYANTGGVIAVGSYGHQQEMVEYIESNHPEFSVITWGQYYVWAVKK
jgi:hypothetical protein